MPRWSIFPMLRQQVVSSHSFHVGLYVAELIEAYHPNWHPQEKYDAVRAALVHDIAEARMSDIPGPVKRRIRDDVKFEQLEHDVVEHLGFGDWLISDDAAKLIKVADLIDEVFHVNIECMMGNRMAMNLRRGVWARLDVALTRWNPNAKWQVQHDIQEQIDAMREFETLQNNDDLMPLVVPPDEAQSEISF